MGRTTHRERMSGTKGLQKVAWEGLLSRLHADVLRADAEPGGERDEAAWGELQRRAQHYANAYARRPSPRMKAELLSSQLDDIVQDVCIKLQKKTILARLRSAVHPAGYLVQMLRNTALDHLRDTHRTVELLPRIVEFLPNDDPPMGDESRAARAFQRGLAQLSDAERALYQEHYLEKRGLSEIAATLRITYSAAAGRVHRLKKRLRGLTESQERDP